MSWTHLVDKNARTYNTIGLIISFVKAFPNQAAVTEAIRANDTPRDYEFLQNLFDWVCRHVTYLEDSFGKEKVYTPDLLLREGRGDCKKMSTFIGAVLNRKGIKHYYKVISYDGKGYEHIYVIVPTKEGGYITMDTVNNCQFNKEIPHEKAAVYDINGEKVELYAMGKPPNQQYASYPLDYGGWNVPTTPWNAYANPYQMYGGSKCPSVAPNFGPGSRAYNAWVTSYFGGRMDSTYFPGYASESIKNKGGQTRSIGAGETNMFLLKDGWCQCYSETLGWIIWKCEKGYPTACRSIEDAIATGTGFTPDPKTGWCQCYSQEFGWIIWKCEKGYPSACRTTTTETAPGLPRTTTPPRPPARTSTRSRFRFRGIDSLDDDLDMYADGELRGLRRKGPDIWTKKMQKNDRWLTFLPLFFLTENGGVYKTGELPQNAKSRISFIKGFIQSNKRDKDSQQVIIDAIAAGIELATGNAPQKQLSILKANPPPPGVGDWGAVLSGHNYAISGEGDIDWAGMWETVKMVWRTIKDLVPSWNKDYAEALQSMFFTSNDWHTVFGIVPTGTAPKGVAWLWNYRVGETINKYYWIDKGGVAHFIDTSPPAARPGAAYVAPLTNAIAEWGYNINDFTITGNLPPNIGQEVLPPTADGIRTFIISHGGMQTKPVVIGDPPIPPVPPPLNMPPGYTPTPPGEFDEPDKGANMLLPAAAVASLLLLG